MARNAQAWIDQANEFQTRGERGLNQGIPYGISSLNNYVAGTQRGRYCLIFAGPGVGKSKFAYDQHVFVPYDYMLANPGVDLHIHLWSLEINPIYIIGAIKVHWLFITHGILTDIDHIFSIGQQKIHAQIKMLLSTKECNDYVNGLMKILYFHTRATHQTIDYTLLEFAKSRGTIIKDNDGKIVGYKPNNEKEIVIIIIDHVSLVRPINRESRKETIDTVSERMNNYRDVFMYAPVIIQQINPEKYTRDVDRVLPKHEDLRDSKNTYQDCDVAISLGSPFKHAIEEFVGYKIIPTAENNYQGLEDRFRVLQVVKNRYGSVSVIIPTSFIGEIGMFSNINPPNKVNYIQAMNLKKYGLK